MLPGEQPLPGEILSNYTKRAPRKETNWIAIIRTSEGIEIPCNVKDVSATGAKIGVPNSYHLPESFLLKVVGKDFVCRVKLAWRKGNFAGVRIEQFGRVVAKQDRPEEIKVKPDDASYTAIRTRRSQVSSF